MRHPSPIHDKQLKLSALQQAVLHWLRREQRRRPQHANAAGIPYPDLVRALDVDRAALSACIRRLIRKRLVVATLPRGAWVRYISLTGRGEAKPRQETSRERKKHRHPSDLWDRKPRRETRTRRRASWKPLVERDRWDETNR